MKIHLFQTKCHRDIKDFIRTSANFLYEDYVKLRELLSNKPVYSPDDLVVPELKEFAPMSQEEVG